ncbi:MAG: amidophosphoribosyltransferase [Cyanophyceae cyanobacterium]|mgnify:FL=1
MTSPVADSTSTHKHPPESLPYSHSSKAPVPSVQPDRPDKPEEACGVFGLYAPESEVAAMTYFGLFALQHRGQESAGIATFDDSRIHLYKDMGLVSQVFNEDILAKLPGYMAIGHTRYSTTGSSKIANAQPLQIATKRGDFALAHNGNLVNAAELRAELREQGVSFETTIDSEAIALALGLEVNAGYDWIEAASRAFKRCSGAFSLVVGTPVGLIGARDPNGVRPLVIGRLPQTGRYVLSSETCGLDIVGAEYVRDVQPGELVIINESGLESKMWADEPNKKMCVFEMIYFARPDSLFNNETLYSYRKRLGRQLAAESKVEADIVIGVPDSGIPAAIGFSEASGITYAEGLIKNRYVGRTFIQPTQAMRETGIRMKLNPLKDVLDGRRVIIVDDSIVRGTTSRKIVKALRDAGAKEVHMRISSPPVTHPCFYGLDTDNQDQLIAAKLSTEAIAKQIGVDTLGYLSEAGMLEVTQDDVDGFCTACFSGKYPIPVPQLLQRSKLMLEEVASHRVGAITPVLEAPMEATEREPLPV